VVAVVIPYVQGKLHEHTRVWGEWNDAEFVELPLGDDTAYWRLLAARWAVPGDLFIVEEDMVPPDRVVERMHRCARPWCTSPYTIGHTQLLVQGLGCTRFAARLKERHPDLLDEVGQVASDGMPARDWRRCDTRIVNALRARGYAPHHKHARSLHLHDYGRR
jgi:hypothetical protein